jgi:ABC-type sugar transport system substrate-binding protein
MGRSHAGGVTRRTLVTASAAMGAAIGLGDIPARAAGKRVAYLTPGLDLPFWRTLANGVADVAKQHGGSSTTYDSHNSAQTQIQNAQDAIARRVDGIVISPTDSSTAPAVLAAAKRANIPVVIADIGTTGGDYVSFIISDNFHGAYGIGTVLAKAMQAKGWGSGTVGLVTISLARNNGQARTKGFMKAMDEAHIKQAALSQMQTYTADETFKFVQDMVTAHPDMRGLFIETDQPTLGALRALHAARKEKDILVAAFDGIPQFVKLIADGTIVGSGMQQPYLMGQTSARAMFDHFAGKTPPKQTLVPILVVTHDNVTQLEPTIHKTVFGQ